MFLKSFTLLLLLATISTFASAADPWVVYEGDAGPGKGKHIVLISGDEEYRSEEALPQLAKILSQHHGFTCTVLFAINPEDGTIDPNNSSNIPGLEALKTADLMVIFTRFRDLKDEQMQHIVDYVNSGKPIVGMRTATHAFNIGPNKSFSDYSWRSKEWDGGFGRQILGETWINHHGRHGAESTRGLIAAEAKDHPITKGIKDGDVWGTTDVYGVRLPLPGDSQPIIMGQVLQGMNPTDAPVEGKKNDPMMPVAWTKSYETKNGNKGRVFTTTMGASQDLTAAGTRRMLVNGCYWALGMEDQIKPESSVEIVSEFEPSPFKMNGFKKGIKPSDYKLN